MNAWTWCKEAIRKLRGRPPIILALCALGIFLDSFCYGTVIPFQPYYVETFNLTETQMGITLASYAFSLVPITPIIGIQT